VEKNPLLQQEGLRKALLNLKVMMMAPQIAEKKHVSWHT
jgi:hypothetical protein